MSAPVCSECGLCRLEGPDRFGNYDLDVRPGCPIHDEAPAQVVPIRPTDFHDKVQDLRAELAPDRFALTVPQAVRHTLDYEAEHSHLHLGRHPFGLPISGTSSARAMTPDAPAATSPAAGAEGSTVFPAAA